MIPTAYKIYAFDGTDYTDISSKVINDPDIPVMIINPDHTPILQGCELETVEDLSATLLADGLFVCFEIGGVKKWYGYIESSRYDTENLTYFYNIFNIYESLKEKTCFSDLYPNITGLGTTRTSAIYSGAPVITWQDIPLKTLIEHIVEHSDYTGLTHTVRWSYGTGFLKTVLENFCVSSLCIKQLGTDYSDEELTAVITDPDVKMWDLLSQLMKFLGLRMYDTGALAITIYGSDTAPAGTDYQGAGYDFGKWVNKYNPVKKKFKEAKRFTLKENIINIEDDRLPDNLHRYFSPVIYGIPWVTINNIVANGSDLDLETATVHNIREIDNIGAKEINIIGQGACEGSWRIGSDCAYKDANELKFYEKNIEETRYIRTNLGSSYSITSITTSVIDKFTAIAIIECDSAEWLAFIAAASVNQFNIQIGSFFSNISIGISGTYAYNGLSASYPSTNYKYNVDVVNNRLYVRGKKILSLQWTSYIDALGTSMEGNITEVTGTPGTPKYISYIHDYAVSGYSFATVKRLYCPADHGITFGSGDVLFIFGTGNADYDGKSWTEQTVLANLAPGEYYVASSMKYLYLYDSGESDVTQAIMKFTFPKYTNQKELTAGKDNADINIMDYLTIYRPDYSTAGDWKEDWFAIDMEDATYCLMTNLASYVPWWLYELSEYYQTIISESYNLDDTVVPVLTTARKIIYNVRDHSINIEQDSV